MGRFRKAGKIITVVEKIEKEIDDGEGWRKRVAKDEKKTRGILGEIRIIPREVEHFG